MKALALILLISGVLLSGCITDAAAPYIGTYKSENPQMHLMFTLTIQDDGTFLETTHDLEYQTNYTEKGVYVIKDGAMQRTGSFGITNIMKLNGVNLTDQDGKVWIRQ